MNSIVENLLKEMEKCNSKNNRCDYLLEHSEIDYLLEYIDQLQQENQKYKEVIDKVSEIICEIDESTKTTGGYPSNYIDDLLGMLKEVE